MRFTLETDSTTQIHEITYLRTRGDQLTDPHDTCVRKEKKQTAHKGLQWIYRRIVEEPQSDIDSLSYRYQWRKTHTCTRTPNESHRFKYVGDSGKAIDPNSNREENQIEKKQTNCTINRAKRLFVQIDRTDYSELSLFPELLWLAFFYSVSFLFLGKAIFTVLNFAVLLHGEWSLFSIVFVAVFSL